MLPIFVLIRIFSCYRDSSGVEYILDFMCLHEKESHGFKSGDQGSHEIGPPLPIQFFDCMLFKYGFNPVEK